MTVNRRDWLRRTSRAIQAIAAGTVLAGIAGLLRLGTGHRHTARPRVDEPPEYSLRPPGALPEPQFLARCIHCYLCQDVCPVGCIQMKSDSQPDRHTPYVMPRVKGCTLCLKCGEACPTGALQPLTEKAQVRMGVARVDEQLCVSHLRSGACGACFTACPMRGKAITQGLFNAPTVHPEHCTGCGLCEEVCIVTYRAIRVYPLDSSKVGTKRESMSVTTFESFHPKAPAFSKDSDLPASGAHAGPPAVGTRLRLNEELVSVPIPSGQEALS